MNKEKIILEMEKQKNLWLDNNNKIIETQFMICYANITNLKYINNSFYDINGYVNKDLLKKNIQDLLLEYVQNGIKSIARKIYDALCNHCLIVDYVAPSNKVNTISSTLTIDNGKVIKNEKEVLVNNLNVELMKTNEVPKKWLLFLQDLLNPRDIKILQEFLGYCILPTYVKQKALFLIGQGGEGKSTLGKVLGCILKNNIHYEAINKLFDDRFGLGNVSNKLMIIDDDMGKTKLKTTGYFKTLISGGTLQGEDKFKDKEDCTPFARIIGFGNYMISADEDDSYSFQRRLIVLQTKPKEKGRRNNPYLTDELIQEKDLIFIWMIKGLLRLQINDMEFSYEEEMEEEVKKIIYNEKQEKNKYYNNVVEFLNDSNWIQYENDCKSFSSNIYTHFLDWCIEKGFNDTPSEKKFYNCSAKYLDTKNLKSETLRIGNERAKGYKGIKMI